MNTGILKAAWVVGLALAAGGAHAAPWQIDSGHSTVGFSVRHMMVSDTRGAFTDFKGTVNWSEKDITKSTVEVEVKTASINTFNTKRDDHLKSPDFFDAAKHPTMTFKSTKVQKSGKNLLVTGNLTLHGVTKPVTLTVEGPGPVMTNPWGQKVSAVKASGTLNRKDFGLTWNKALEAGGVVVGDEVTLIIEAELNPAK